jgi:hypothetical protein
MRRQADVAVLQLLVRLLDWWLDRLIGPSWHEPLPPQLTSGVEPPIYALCPVCEEDVVFAEPHLHGVVAVRMTTWPEPGVLVTIEPKEDE